MMLFKSDLSTLRGDLSHSAWHLWLKFRKGVKLSVRNKNWYWSSGEEKGLSWFYEHSRSHPALRPTQQKCGSVISLLRMGLLLRHSGAVEMDMWFSNAWDRLVIKYSSILWSYQLSLLHIGNMRKVLHKNQNLGKTSKKTPQLWAKNIDKMGQRCLETPEQEGMEFWPSR